MSGTSMDAVDVAIVDFSGAGCRVVDYRQYPVPSDLQSRLKSVTPDTGLRTLLSLDAEVGTLFADAARNAMVSCGLDADSVHVVGSHGQTLLHCPGEPIRNTLQVGDPNRIAWATGVRTVADYRRMDMAAGGQGAPLAPCFHAWRFRSTTANRAVVNLGGIANLSLLPAENGAPVLGFDTGPGNTLLDQWIQHQRGLPYDADGAWAASGTIDPDMLSLLRAEPYFTMPAPKSTGREFFNLDWLARRAGRHINALPAADVQATLLELSAVTIADAALRCSPAVAEVYICGGGADNGQLVRRLATLLHPLPVQTTEVLGVPPAAVEAVMIAWLAKCRVEHHAAGLPSVTGARRRVVLGAVYEPGPTPESAG